MKLEDIAPNYPFYKRSRDLWLETQGKQIEKGLEKYPEPFDPHHWTPQELLEHAMQENVDQHHYMVGLFVWVESLMKRVQEIKDVHGIQAENGNWNFNPYMMGMFNGLELALCLIEEREPRYKDAPSEWLEDMIPDFQTPPSEQLEDKIAHAD